MYKIESETKRSMARTWGIATVAFIAPTVIAFRFSTATAIETIVLFPLLLASLPLIGQCIREKQAQRAEARERWRQEYRASPDSRLIRLNDSN
jgi:hypothetical protein